MILHEFDQNVTRSFMLCLVSWVDFFFMLVLPVVYMSFEVTEEIGISYSSYEVIFTNVLNMKWVAPNFLQKPRLAQSSQMEVFWEAKTRSLSSLIKCEGASNRFLLLQWNCSSQIANIRLYSSTQLPWSFMQFVWGILEKITQNL